MWRVVSLNYWRKAISNLEEVIQVNAVSFFRFLAADRLYIGCTWTLPVNAGIQPMSLRPRRTYAYYHSSTVNSLRLSSSSTFSRVAATSTSGCSPFNVNWSHSLCHSPARWTPRDYYQYSRAHEARCHGDQAPVPHTIERPDTMGTVNTAFQLNTLVQCSKVIYKAY